MKDYRHAKFFFFFFFCFWILCMSIVNQKIYGYIRIDNFVFNIFMNYDYCINTITWTPKLKILATPLSIRVLNSLHLNKYTTSFAVHITNPLLQHKLQPYQTVALANHMHQQVPLYTQVMFAVLHVLLNTSLNNTLLSHCVFIHANTYPYIQLLPREYLPLKNSYIKSHLHLSLQNIYTYKSPIYIYPCKTSTHTVQKSHFPMSMRNWMLPRFPDNYRTKRDSDEREYYAGMRREWDFCVNESNALHDDLVQLGAPLADHVSLTLSQRNMHQYECAVTKIKKREQSNDTPQVQVSHATAGERAGRRNEEATHSGGT